MRTVKGWSIQLTGTLREGNRLVFIAANRLQKLIHADVTPSQAAAPRPPDNLADGPRFSRQSSHPAIIRFSAFHSVPL